MPFSKNKNENSIAVRQPNFTDLERQEDELPTG